MSLLLSAAAVAQLCTGCDVSFEALDTLGASDDPAGVGMIADVLRIGNQGYLVSSEALGGVVIVYDTAGSYKRELTRLGDGPGELRGPPRFALGTGGIALQERFAADLHLRLAGGRAPSDPRFSAPAAGATGGGVVHPP